ncbi:hypothetical protein CGLO_14760 [Colletotrichum gloeosporioides Cg-14]|uniref:Uncharacterized protein n=1 Tax=Colletotrichum gloeosporioides (strain Cg-14) TaxID=1237896 RepID=T0LCZ8_COLGC|nr:hypothetical protein CGLO_14760 [Colletotrichum gloeosporioides Cg-14]
MKQNEEGEHHVKTTH